VGDTFKLDQLFVIKTMHNIFGNRCLKRLLAIDVGQESTNNKRLCRSTLLQRMIQFLQKFRKTTFTYV